MIATKTMMKVMKMTMDRMMVILDNQQNVEWFQIEKGLLSLVPLASINSINRIIKLFSW